MTKNIVLSSLVFSDTNLHQIKANTKKNQMLKNSTKYNSFQFLSTEPIGK